MAASDVPKEDVDAGRRARIAAETERQRVLAEINRAKAAAEQKAFGEGDQG